MKFKNILKVISLALIISFAGCKGDEGDTNPPEENDTTATPAVVSSSPADGGTDIALNKTVSVAFNQEMNVSSFDSVSFTLKKGSSSVNGLISYKSHTATFKPLSSLLANTTYTAVLSTEIESNSGERLKEAYEWKFTTGINATGLSKVALGSSKEYVILAKTAINNNPTSAISGNIGISPSAASFITGLSIVAATGYATSAQITGKVYAADMAAPTPSNLTTAISDMILAYNDASGRSNPDYNELWTGNIGGKTVVPGLYKWTNTVTAPTDVIISGSATDVWIFQIAKDLTVSSNVNFVLSGGAKAENIFWQVAGEVTIGTEADFKGVIMSMTGITLQTGAVLNGRAFAQSAVIMDANTVTQP